ncbi:MAG: transcription-repair coupling factor, partial [Gammaproteobacteria bacterium]
MRTDESSVDYGEIPEAMGMIRYTARLFPARHRMPNPSPTHLFQLNWPSQGQQRWQQPQGSALALALAEAVQRATGPVLLMLPENAQLESMSDALRFFLPEDYPVLGFPDWETLAYDRFSPHPDQIAERLRTLQQLPQLQRGVVVAGATALLGKVAPQAWIQREALSLRKGQRIDRESFRLQLEHSGYQLSSQVMEHGEYALRGSLIDLFPVGSDQPLRIDLFDDEIESLRYFEPETQRSGEHIEQLQLLPAREFPLNEEGIKHFRQQWRARFAGDPNESPLYRDVSQGLAPSGIEYYLPLFHNALESVLDALPKSTHVLLLGELEPILKAFFAETEERYQERRLDPERPVLEPTELFLQPEALFSALHAFPRVRMDRFEDESGVHALVSRTPPALRIQHRQEQPLEALLNFIEDIENQRGRVLLAAESAGRRQALIELLAPYGQRPYPVEGWQEFLQSDVALCITLAPLEQGLWLEQPNVAVVAESQLHGEQVLQRRRRKRAGMDPDAVIHSLTELKPGDPVVHLEHGVGRYRGLQTLDAGGMVAEYLVLEYDRADKLYVPVSSLHLVGRYSGAEADKAPLHRLGSDQWEKARKKAAQKARDSAAELLAIYAKRAAREGRPVDLVEDAWLRFSSEFAFEETPDQHNAIHAVLEDMRASRPMDRLICGDVGFGKTEVAMRAAFLAVHAGRQVAVLVPTTLLAQQHFENFRDRFADWPVRIEVVSRFRAGGETEQALKDTADGKVDILIGTHKLLQPDVKFKDLGLVIIDEEHRFGVRQKERFKALRAEVHVLTLTATPIPRTLNLSLAGLRDLSIIATPPTNRVAIKTFVREWDPALIREACLREIRRGGQVYFLHNQVETIERTAREIAELLPEASVAIAHGQMRERELEEVMRDFYHRRANILVCTTIIETGIDIPTANTIIMDRADRLGLAQLYQLRGRVGRSHHRAYAYLIVPPRGSMTADAVKRLEAIAALEDLGVGFTLAVHDMEIRGAGELLGEGQSGHMQEIGFELYAEMLERAVADLKAGRAPDPEADIGKDSEVDLRAPALIPEDYLPDVNARLVMYKRIATAADAAALDELQVEMIDRFGLLPEALKTLFQVTLLRQHARALGIQKIEAHAEGARLRFGESPNLDPSRILELIQTQPKTYQLDGPTGLRVIADWESPSARGD